MDIARFTASLVSLSPPDELGPSLKALWWDGKGDWERAHGCVDNGEDERSMRVHAYLHRKNGETSNAAYWYGQAGVPMPDASSDEERVTLLRDLLSEAR